MGHHGGRTLSVEDVRSLLSEMGEEVASTGRRVEIAVYGGAALLLHFDDRPSTLDVDYVGISEGSMEDLAPAADKVGARNGMPDGWFNEAVAMFVSDRQELLPHGDYPPRGPGGLRVLLASPRYILAMKMMAMRSTRDANDTLDLWNLVEHCGIGSVEDAASWVERFYPGEVLPERTKAIMADLLEAKAEGRTYDPMMGW
jgi:hypothetical protein